MGAYEFSEVGVMSFGEYENVSATGSSQPDSSGKISLFDGDYTILNIPNISKQYKKGDGTGVNPKVEQVPVILAVPSPAALRGRISPYIVSGST